MDTKNTFLFDRRKYVMLIAGLLMLVIGFALMLGGGAEAQNEFNPEIFSAQRIGVAPWFLFIGLVLPIVAIMMPLKEAA
jgi:TRAP-type C4-dicarboxylate transport system permease small subunit